MVWCITRSGQIPKKHIPTCAGSGSQAPENPGSGSQAPENSTGSHIVTVDNYVRAQSDQYFQNTVDGGGFGKIVHQLIPTPLEHQTVIRMNRDTLYSAGVFDLDAAPIVVHKPHPGSRFQSLAFINQDNSVFPIKNQAGDYHMFRNQAGTRYIMVLFRTFVNAASKEDIAQANALQFRISVDQRSAGKFEIPTWDLTSMTTIRTAINTLAATCHNYNEFFGEAWNKNPIYHLMGTAAGWGGSPKYESMYWSYVPPKNDGKVAYILTMSDVPIRPGGFWSVTVYNAAGYMEKGSAGQPSYNSVTGIKNADGSITIHFGGSTSHANYIPIFDGWNYTVRCYLPMKAMVDGCWKPPPAIEATDSSSSTASA